MWFLTETIINKIKKVTTCLNKSNVNRINFILVHNTNQNECTSKNLGIPMFKFLNSEMNQKL